MFKVCEKKCDQCLFTNERIVRKGRVAEILKECEAKDTYFVCHKASFAGEEICCAGFYDRNPMASNLMRIAHRLGMVKRVPIPAVPKP